MSSRIPLAVTNILARYAAGFFPLYDLANRFYWERLSIRAILPVSPEAVASAERLARRAKPRFEIRYTTSVEKIITLLQDERVKENTWVRAEVAAMYRLLHAAGLLQTVETWSRDSGKLAGAVVGLVLPGTFIAETMFSLAPDASKVALCHLLHDAHAAGHRLIDVQTPHHLDENGIPRELTGKTVHPCLRLGETVLTLSTFLRSMQQAAAATFPGTLNDWLAIASACARHATDGDAAPTLPHLNPRLVEAAWPMLRHNYSRAEPSSPGPI